MTEAWSFRPGTLDRMIFDGVVALDEYRLPERFEPDDVVVDVGGHIGSFAYAVVRRGGKHVWSIEPDRTNCAFAAEHLRPYVDQGTLGGATDRGPRGGDDDGFRHADPPVSVGLCKDEP